MRERVGGRRLQVRISKKIVDQHALPEGVELRPDRDAWMSRVILVCGRASNSAQFHFATVRGPTFSVNVQSSVLIRGVAPADKTGKSEMICWPGGRRAG